jgi:DNA-binding transcriptional LysR family regulator
MIEVRKLRHIVALAQAGSYARAAQALNISQPALTRSIQSVEQRFGVLLFDRGRRGVTLTATGRRIAAEGQLLLRDAEALERNLRLLGESRLGDISFGVDPLAAGVFLVDVLAFVGAKYVGLNLEAVVQDAAVLEQRLLDHEVEFLIIPRGTLSDTPHIVQEALLTVRAGLLVRPGHPLAGRGRVSVDDVARFPLIGGRLPEHVKHSGGENVFWRAATIRCDDYGLMREVAMRSDAIWLASPALASRAGEPPTLVELPVEQETLIPRAEFVIAAFKGLSRSPAASMLIGKFKELSAELATRVV